jgi:fatty-acyl-CoA synthase
MTAIAEICRSAGTKVLVALADFPGSAIWERVSAIRHQLPTLKAIVRVMGPSDEKERIVGYDDVISGYRGNQDNDGYFWLTGRTKELIIRGGHNIDPAVIENPLYRLPGVKVAAAVGQPDLQAGEIPVAYVQLQNGVKLSSEEILDYLQQAIEERAAIPKQVIFIEEMLLTSVGKIFKPALRWESIKRVYQGELQALGGSAASVEVTVGEDKFYGAMATLTIKPASGVAKTEIEKKVADIFARYPIKYTLQLI